MGSKSSTTPSVPTAAETSRQSIQAQIESLPEILSAQKEFGPQFAQEQLDLAQQFQPQLFQTQLDLQRQFAQPFAEQFLAEQEILAPEAVAGRKALTSFLGGGAQQLFADEIGAATQEYLNPQAEVLSGAQRRNLEQDIRSAQGQRGIGLISPLGAIEEAGALESLRQQIRGQRLQARTSAATSIFGSEQQTAAQALGALGNIPSGFQSFSPTFSQPQLVQNVTPGQVFGMTTSLAPLNAQLAQQQAAQQRSSSSTLGGIFGGAVGGIFGGPTGATVGGTLGSSIGGLF